MILKLFFILSYPTSSRILVLHNKIDVINRVNCLTGCKTCQKFNGNLDCLECLPGHVLKHNKCNLCYVYGCGECEHSLKRCFRCAPGYFDPNAKENQSDKVITTCKECTSNCKTCNNTDSCFSCNPGYRLNSSKKCVMDYTWYWIIGLALFLMLVVALIFIFRNAISEAMKKSKKRKRSRSKSRKRRSGRSKNRHHKNRKDENLHIELEDVIPPDDTLGLGNMTGSASRPALSKKFNQGFMSYKSGKKKDKDKNERTKRNRRLTSDRRHTKHSSKAQ